MGHGGAGMRTDFKVGVLEGGEDGGHGAGVGQFGGDAAEGPDGHGSEGGFLFLRGLQNFHKRLNTGLCLW